MEKFCWHENGWPLSRWSFHHIYSDNVTQCRRDPELGAGREMTTRKVTDGGAKGTDLHEKGGFIRATGRQRSLPWNRPEHGSDLYPYWSHLVDFQASVVKPNITLANHSTRRSSNKRIRSRSRYTLFSPPTPSAGKRMKASQYLLWFYFWLVEKVVRLISTIQKA